jgi:hypothetical protein
MTSSIIITVFSTTCVLMFFEGVAFNSCQRQSHFLFDREGKDECVNAYHFFTSPLSHVILLQMYQIPHRINLWEAYDGAVS